MSADSPPDRELTDEEADALLDRVMERAQERDDVNEDNVVSRLNRRGFLKKGGAAVGGLGLLSTSAGSAESESLESLAAPDWSNATGNSGTESEPFANVYAQNAYHESVETDELQGTYRGKVRAVASNGVVASIDPSKSSAPVQDALDAVDADGGGRVELPPDTTIAEAGPVRPYSGTKIVGNGATIEIQNDGADGIKIDRGGFVQFDIGGRLTVRHANGPGGNTGIGVNMSNGGLEYSTWGSVQIEDWNGRGWYEHGGKSPFKNTYQTLFFNNVDAGNAPAVVHRAAGGAADVVGHVYLQPTDSSSGTDSTGIFNDAGGTWYTGVVQAARNTGICYDQSVGGSDYIGHLNYEPNGLTTTPPYVAFMDGFRPTKIASARHVNGTVDTFYKVSGTSYRIYMGHFLSDGTINNTKVTVSDTDGPVIYEGVSSDVGGTGVGSGMSPGVACLGDLTLVT